MYRRAVRAFEGRPTIYGVLLALQNVSEPHASQAFHVFAERQRVAFDSVLSRVPEAKRRTVVAVMGAVLDVNLRNWRLGHQPIGACYQAVDDAADLIFQRLTNPTIWGTTMPNTVDFPAFDADNHYYEALDAFTRHIEPQYAQAGDAVGGRRRQAAPARRRAGQPLHPEPDVRPGRPSPAPRRVLPRPQPEGAGHPRAVRRARADRPAPEYRDRDARLEVMDEQGLEAAFFFPTLGVGMEQALIDDIPALQAAFRAFNRWLDEDWGFNYRDRIYSARVTSR